MAKDEERMGRWLARGGLGWAQMLDDYRLDGLIFDRGALEILKVIRAKVSAAIAAQEGGEVSQEAGQARPPRPRALRRS